MDANDIRDAISELTLELNKQRQLADQYTAMSNAAADVSRLTIELDKLTSNLNDAMAAEAKAKEQRFKDSIRNPRVSFTANRLGASFIHGAFKISWEVPVSNRFSGEIEWQERQAEGFRALDRSVLEWMMTYSPQSFPQDIRDLAPGNIEEALSRFFLALKRGYLPS